MLPLTVVIYARLCFEKVCDKQDKFSYGYSIVETNFPNIISLFLIGNYLRQDHHDCHSEKRMILIMTSEALLVLSVFLLKQIKLFCLSFPHGTE